MRYKQFGSTGFEVSAIGYGTWPISAMYWGTDIDDEVSIRSIRSAIDQGINLVDTAPIYGATHSEQVVGKALKDGYRDKVFLTTKCGLDYTYFAAEHRGVNDTSAKRVRFDCENSLRIMGVDYIDLLLIHWPSRTGVPLEETCSELNKLQEEGKIRFIGASNFSPELVDEARQYCKFDVLQHRLSIITRFGEDAMKYAHSIGLGTMTHGSLEGGVLTGNYRVPPKFPDGDERYGTYKHFQEPYYSDAMKIVAVLEEIAEAHGRPVSEVALNWNTQKDFVSTALVGMRNPEEVANAVHAMEWELTEEEIQRIDEFSAPLIRQK